MGERVHKRWAGDEADDILDSSCTLRMVSADDSSPREGSALYALERTYTRHPNSMTKDEIERVHKRWAGDEADDILDSSGGSALYALERTYTRHPNAMSKDEIERVHKR